jgi:uncharacterized protein (TIGR02300 family)
VAKPELGTKRLCPSCGTKYYDLNRDPILCPKCGTVFEASALPVRPEKASKVVPVDEEVETEEDTGDVEIVTLEEADAEAGGEDVPEIEDEEIADIDAGDEEDTFLEEEDEGDDVTDIVGGVEDEEER